MYKDSYHIIGVMSGTSLDGVDLCYTNFTFNNKWNYKIFNAITYNYTEQWKKRLLNSINLSKTDLYNLDIDYTNLLSLYIQDFISKFNIDRIDSISSHGHTVLHQPQKNITYQIGNLPSLSKNLNINVVCNFRIQDVELGGQGAPLVPIGDQLLFPDYKYCLNLGGFSNISYKCNSKITAFDICPVNTVLNHYSNIIGYDFDKDGLIAREGKIESKLLDELNSIEYYSKFNPKSLGIEWVINIIYNIIDKYNLSIPDILRTYSEHIAIQTQNAVKNNTSTILITGGGVRNKFLIELITNRLENHINIPDDILIDFKEALIFGFLGVLRLRNENNCLSSVTGASKNHSSGKIYQ
ncbi:MAG: anhydro-N-acetylmuramic acid kinase [Bacteroidia bacterium]|jgi:anhydro-N-acetylmuramic acid kinase|nr:anhydro-N-acetylmuramic acid kinase [Bacteroidia bacterium]